MRVYRSKSKNILYFVYRVIYPIFDPIWFITGIYGYFWFIKDIVNYQRQSKTLLMGKNLYPMLHDKVNFSPFNSHYYYMSLWVFDRIIKQKPTSHVDIGSSYEFSGYLSRLIKTTFIDLRPINVKAKNLAIKKGNILNLPYKDQSIKSLSCLHVAEHIGLGRYGDTVGPKGTEKACTELSRVLAPNGLLYFAVPIGKEKVCFNAHRIFPPKKIIKMFPKLKLIEFSLVNDNGIFLEKQNTNLFNNLNYGCGMFLFKKNYD